MKEPEDPRSSPGWGVMSNRRSAGTYFVLGFIPVFDDLRLKLNLSLFHKLILGALIVVAQEDDGWSICLKPKDLAAMLNVSVASVRRGLRILEDEGLVTKAPCGRGRHFYYLAEPDGRL